MEYSGPLATVPSRQSLIEHTDARVLLPLFDGDPFHDGSHRGR